MPDITAAEATGRTIRQGDFVACNLAFVDCKTPGSHLKQNYSMIGPGVTTSTDQVINLREPHGFNIGAAAMPHGIVNNLHMHFTAEVFMCFDGEYEVRWGPDGKDGTLTVRAGDIISIPTWIFRGFTNTGPDEGFLFTCLGGDNTGGIIWHPSILAGAAEHGLFLTRDNVLVDTAAGGIRPAEDALMQPISAADIGAMRKWSVPEMAARVVMADRRGFERLALLDSVLPGHESEMAPVIGFGMSAARGVVPPIAGDHGFAMEWLRLAPGQSVSTHQMPDKQVLMVWRGEARVELNAQGDVVEALATRDMISVPGGVWRAIVNAGETALEVLVITAGDGRSLPVFRPETVAAALAAGIGIDPAGRIAPAHLLPVYGPGG